MFLRLAASVGFEAADLVRVVAATEKIVWGEKTPSGADIPPNDSELLHRAGVEDHVGRLRSFTQRHP